ncbi:MAG: putative type II secretion system protein F [Phycisphaerae bacterium]|nr:putative type II secretion system protein F [Phycisphaerae bacterium]
MLVEHSDADELIMPTFTYRAMSSTGQASNGTLVAENQQAALALLQERALFPVEVKEGGESKKASLLGRQRAIKVRHLTMFYGQLADLLRAGVPVLRALDVLARQSSNPMLAEMVREIREDVAGGMSLADAMEKHPRAFRDLHVAMVRAGERGGFLEEVLGRIAIFTEREDELRNKLVGSMIYPAILVTVGTSLIVVLLTVVVPQLRKFIERADPNILTRVVFALCDVLREYGVFLAAGLAVVIMLLVMMGRSDAGRQKIDQWKLRVPVLGKTLVMIALCRFCRILGTMLASGVPILQALRISRDSMGNRLLQEEVDKATDNVQKGGMIAQTFSKCVYFPLDIVDMIAVAEESNKLENVLVQVADTNETRTARMIDMGVRLIEPILLVVMAGVIAIIAMALLVPILTMSSKMKM